MQTRFVIFLFIVVMHQPILPILSTSLSLWGNLSIEICVYMTGKRFILNILKIEKSMTCWYHVEKHIAMSTADWNVERCCNFDDFKCQFYQRIVFFIDRSEPFFYWDNQGTHVNTNIYWYIIGFVRRNLIYHLHHLESANYFAIFKYFPVSKDSYLI